MKAVLISIQPQWCELIASGEKTIEVRKTRPKIETPFKCYIYMTSKGNKPIKEVETPNGSVYIEVNYKMAGKVIGEFVCDSITCCQVYYGSSGEKHLTNIFGIDIKNTCLSAHEIFYYIIGKDKKEGTGWLWHISDLKIYDKPKELGEFRKPCNHINDCCTCKEAEFQYDGDELRGLVCRREIPLIRPPQSWCYIEV